MPRSALLLLVLSCALAVPSNAAGLVPERPFASTSVWNSPLREAAPLVANSAAMVADLRRQVRSAGVWINSHEWSVPVYRPAAGAATVPVTIDASSAMFTTLGDAQTLQGRLTAVPIPPGARPAAGTDGHLVIWQPSTDTLWELWRARPVPGAGGLVWQAAWGSRIDRVSESDGTNLAPFGATASGLPITGGLMTREEIRRRDIPHALALALPDTAAGRWVWPAGRTDGRSVVTDAIPQGSRLRLDPKLDVASLRLPPLTRAMALAAQRYGIIVRDHAGAVAFYAEDPSRFGITYDWAGGLDPAQALARFPWSRLQVVVPDPAALNARPAALAADPVKKPKKVKAKARPRQCAARTARCAPRS